jgi:predicted nucleotide-binding protein
MTEREKYIQELKNFRKLILKWEKGTQNDYIRTSINKLIHKVEKLARIAGTEKRFDMIRNYRDSQVRLSAQNPFDFIFEPPLDYQSVIPLIIDIVDETIGVIESNEEFSLNPTKDDKKELEIFDTKRVFLVHGRDNELKEATARFLGNLGLEPVILHEQANKGQTIIEKFEANSDVAFAVVLITPDDVGALAGEEDKLKKRARQNVLFELGFFIGKLGRKRVIALLKDEIEIPSDFDAVVYTKVDGNDDWKFKLAKELKAGGLDIDLNKI